MEKNDIIENTGHDAKGAKGFDYQFLYFINRLLKMADKRDDVSYEKYDDVSMSSEEGLVYFQLKHTIGGGVIKKLLILACEIMTCGRP